MVRFRTTPLERYQHLALAKSLSQPHRYPIACKELSFILKEAYHKFPKNLQAIIFQDTLTAFRLLPELQSQNAVSAAHFLFQSVQTALPKQKRNTAVTEYKHAIVAHKRRYQAQQVEEGSFHLPQDVLEHVFSFLDMQSLISAELVCRSWNSTANDNNLWQLQYAALHGGGATHQPTGLVENKNSRLLSKPIDTRTITDWKEAVKTAFTGALSKKFRGYCELCKTVVWLTNSKCPNVRCGMIDVKPVTASQVVEYLLDHFGLIKTYSDSESDSEEEGPVSRLWAYPKHIGEI